MKNFQPINYPPVNWCGMLNSHEGVSINENNNYIVSGGYFILYSERFSKPLFCYTLAVGIDFIIGQGEGEGDYLIPPSFISHIEVVTKKNFSWEPWEMGLPGDISNLNLDLPLPEPPCKFCKFWSPKIELMEVEERKLFNGVTCCHNEEEMCSDFSCFEK